jgi:hypothetical protein
LSGSCLAINRDAWDSVGPFDEEFFLYGEEADWQRRAISAGWQVHLAEELAVKHSAGGTVADDAAASRRSQDLHRAHVALELEYQQGRLAAEIYLAAASVIEVVRQRCRSEAGTRSSPKGIAITIDGAELVAAEDRIRLATTLLNEGYAVTVVSLQRLGKLPQYIPTPIRLLRRPWWLPTLPSPTPRVLVVGTTRRERLYARVFRLGRIKISLHSNASIDEITMAVDRR